MSCELIRNCINCKHYTDISVKIYDGAARGLCHHPVASLPRKSSEPQYLQGAYPWDCLCRGARAKFMCVYKHTNEHKDEDCECMNADGETGHICPYGLRAATDIAVTEIGPLDLDARTVQYGGGCAGFEMQDEKKIEDLFRNRRLDQPSSYNKAESKDRMDSLIKLGFATKSNSHSVAYKTKALDLFANIEPCLANRATDEGRAALRLVYWIAESLGTYGQTRSIKNGGITLSPYGNPILKRLINEAEEKAKEKFSKKRGKK